MGWPLMNPGSFPKAIKLPVNVRVPTKIYTMTVESVKVEMVPELRNSAAATRADALPPNPLKMATI